MENKFISLSRVGLATVAISAFCFGSSAWAAEKKSAATAGLDQSDKDFMMEAAKGGAMEVEMGKVAEQKGKNADVKKFGKTMVTDHTKANNQLLALAKKKGVTVDTSAKAEKMSDANFDQEYMDDMVKDHEKDVAAFEKQAKDGKDADVKSWANKTLPTLKKHLQMAKDTQNKLKKS